MIERSAASLHTQTIFWRRLLAPCALVLAAAAIAPGVLRAENLAGEYRAYEQALATGDLPAARKHARTALDLGLTEYGPRDARVAILYNNLGGLYSRSGEYERAEEYYRRALSIYRERQGPEGAGVSTVYNNLGRVCEKDARLDCARRRYEQAIAITRKTQGETHPLLAVRYNNLAGVLLRRGQTDAALGYYRKALTINIERLGREDARTTKTMANLAGAYRRRGNLDKAERYYREALEGGRQQAGADHPEVATREANLAGIKRIQGDMVSALRLYRSALGTFQRGGFRDEYLRTLKNLALAQSEVPNYRHAAATLRTGIKAVLGYRLQIGHGKAEFTRRHIDLFDQLFLLSMREAQHAAAFEADMLKRGLSIAEGLALPAALERGGVPADLRSSFLENRRLLEQSRSRRVALLNAGKTQAASRLMEATLSRERRQADLDAGLIRDYPDYALLRAPYIPRLAEIREQLRPGEILISYNFSFPRAMAFVVDKERGLAVLPLGREGRADSQKISHLIRNLHTLLSGAAGDDSRMCPCFKIRTPAGDTIYWNQALAVPPWSGSGTYELEDGVVYRRASVSGVAAKDGDRSAHKRAGAPRKRIGVVEGDWFDGDEVPARRAALLKELYAELMGPILARYPAARKLIIVPDGAAYYLPFNLLQNEQGKMLVDRIRMKMIHSPVVWYRLRTGRRTRARLPLFGVGNAVYAAGHPESAADFTPARAGSEQDRPEQDRSNQARAGSPGSLADTIWDNLPGTLEEIRDIARLAYGSQMGAASEEHLLHGRQASRERFLKINTAGLLGKYKILHFSLHGLFVDANPDLNALVFSDPRFIGGPSRAAGLPRIDRFLRLGDVKTLRLDADLVVMSACETSLGRTSPGEGMVGLPQGFLIAGSRNVLATLWAVDDNATRELMRYFYEYVLREKKTPEEALRLAQLKLRETRPDPFYWAAFELFGE